MADLNPQQFINVRDRAGGSKDFEHLDDNGGVIGRLSVHPKEDRYEIGYVMTEPHVRRQGVATRLLEKARQDLGRVDHSPHLSVDGKPWAKARP